MDARLTAGHDGEGSISAALDVMPAKAGIPYDLSAATAHRMLWPSLPPPLHSLALDATAHRMLGSSPSKAIA